MTDSSSGPGSPEPDDAATPVDGADPAEGADDAPAPGHLPAASWRALLVRALQHLHSSRLPLLCAGAAFFAVLSIAPVLVTALSVYGAVTSPEQGLAQLEEVAEVLPPEVEAIVADQLTSITAASDRTLTVRGAAGLVAALWTATVAALALIDALTVAYHETETRSFFRRVLLALGFVLGGALVLGALLTAAGLASPVLAQAPDGVRAAWWLGSWLLLAGLMSAVVSLLYRFAPDRKQARWQWTSWGAAGATVLWVVISLGFFGYAQTLGTYESTYGSLAGVAISMFWVWVTVLLVVAGAAVNGESERQTARDSTVGRERPLGSRGAVVADSTPDHLHRPRRGG